MSEPLNLKPQIQYNAAASCCEIPSQDTVGSNATPAKDETGISLPSKYLARPANQALFSPSRDAFAGFPSLPAQDQRSWLHSFLAGIFMAAPLACGSDDSGSFPTESSDDDSTGGSSPSSGSGGSTQTGIGGATGVGGSAGEAGDAGNAGDGGGGGVGGGTGVTDLLTRAESFGTAPCGTGSYITDLDPETGVCAGGTEGSHLFGWDPETEGSITALNQLGFAPDQLLQGEGGVLYITTHGNAAEGQAPGMAVVNASMSEPVQHQEFPTNTFTEPRLNSKGDPVTQLTPSMPKGMAESGDFIFVATSNLRIPSPADVSQNYFDPGTVQVYRKSTGSWQLPLETGGFNPTSVTVLGNRLYVINTGAESTEGEATTPSSVDVFNAITHERIVEESFSLGSVAAGISGEITASSDGSTLILPTGDNSGRLIIVDLLDRSSWEFHLPVDGEKIFLNSVVLDPSKPWVYVGNLNDGMVYAMDLTTGEHLDTLLVDTSAAEIATNPQAFLGLSDGLWSGSHLYLGMGPQVMRVSVNSNL